MNSDALDPSGTSFWITVVSAILCGAIVGLERQLRGKPAGVRTAILICLSTAVFVSLGRAEAGQGSDPTRILGQVVTGVGFLGAGVMFAQNGVVTGVTTAAVIWVLSAVGVTIGFGHIATALALALISVAILAGVEGLESSLVSLNRGVHARNDSLDGPIPGERSI